MPGSNGNGLRPEEEHVLGMSNTEDVSSVNDGKKSITAWLGLASAIGGGALNLWMNERNNRYNREQNEQAYQQNLQMWNLQNAYNLPANQIARLKQAGLNPNLIYGNPDNTAGAPPEKEGAKGERGAVDPMAITNALLMQKQMENLQADNEVKLAEARNINADTENKKLDNKAKEFSNSNLEEVFNYFRDEKQVSIDLMRSIEENNKETKKRITQEFDQFEKIADKLIEKIDKELRNSDKEYEVLGQELKNLVQEFNARAKEVKLFYDTPFTLDGQNGSYAWHQQRLDLLQGSNEVSLGWKENYSAQLANSLQYFEYKIESAKFPAQLKKINDDYGFWLNSYYREFTDEIVSPFFYSLGNILHGNTSSSTLTPIKSAGFNYSGRKSSSRVVKRLLRM